MKFSDLFKMAAENLLSRKLRTFLTVLGVIIGATAIIVIISIGRGFKYMNERSFESMGDMRILELNSPNAPMFEEGGNGGIVQDTKKKKAMNDAAVKDVASIEHVKAAIPVFEANINLKKGKEVAQYMSLVGLPPEHFEDYGITLDQGRTVSNGEKNFVAVCGPLLKNQFYDPNKRYYFGGDTKKPLMGQKISITWIQSTNPDEMGQQDMGMDFGSETSQDKKQVPIKISGEMVETNDWRKDSGIYMSIESYKNLASQFGIKSKNKKNYHNIKVVVDEIKNVDQVSKALKEKGYKPFNMTRQFLEETNKQIAIVQMVFGGIGAISFIIAAIGISNTMIMSIYERTKEIGIMKVIGASIKDIQRLFLLEASLIGLLGGIIAVINSLIISKLANVFFGNYFLNQLGGNATVEPKISIVSFGLILTALLFSTFIGLLSGYLPARRAMKLSALDAIRSE